MKKTILTLIGFLCILNVFAQSPQAFNYQTIVRNTSGSIIPNQNVSLRIILLQGSATGTPVFVEEHAAITNTFGLVNLKIGNGTVISGTFASIDWSAGSYFIGIEIDVTGGNTFIAMGVSQLLSVPYALFAASGNQGQQGIQGLPDINGQNAISISWLGTFTSNPINPSINQAYYNLTDKKSYIFDGSAWQIIAQDGMQGLQGIQGIQGTGGIYVAGAGIQISNDTISTTASGIHGNLQFNNSGVFGGNNLLFWNNNNLRLGVGTSLPTSTLHINGTLRITDDTEGAGKILTSDALGNASWQNPVSGSSFTGTQNRIAKFTSSNSIGNSLLYENGNYIGLGTTNPIGRFVVQGDSLTNDSIPLFEVKNKSGQTVFVVWPTGAQLFVTADTTGSKAAQNKGCFAVSGRTTSKDVVKDYLSVNADSIKASKSLYIPRMTTVERDALSFTPSEALIIFNTTDKCMEIFENGVWSNIWCFQCSPNVIIQPFNATICNGEDTSFIVSATGTNIMFQWQKSMDGGTTWSDLTNGGTSPVYSGSTSSMLLLANIPVGSNGYKYRCSIISSCPPVTFSNIVTLNVGAPTLTIVTQPSNQTIPSGCNTDFSITTSALRCRCDFFL